MGHEQRRLLEADARRLRHPAWVRSLPIRQLIARSSQQRSQHFLLDWKVASGRPPWYRRHPPAGVSNTGAESAAPSTPGHQQPLPAGFRAANARRRCPQEPLAAGRRIDQRMNSYANETFFAAAPSHLALVPAGTRQTGRWTDEQLAAPDRSLG